MLFTKLKFQTFPSTKDRRRYIGRLEVKRFKIIDIIFRFWSTSVELEFLKIDLIIDGFKHFVVIFF